MDPTTHPYITAAFSGLTAGLVGLCHDVPAWAPRWALTSLSKGALMPTIDDLNKAFQHFQGLIKMVAPIVPGDTADAKAATLDGVIDPLVNKWLQDANAPGEFIAFVNNAIDWAIKAELHAAGV